MHGGFCQVSSGTKLTHHLPAECVAPPDTNKCMCTVFRERQHPVFYLDFKAGWIGDISEIHISCTVADTSSNLINILNGNEVSYHTFGYAIWTHACWRVWALSPQFRWLHTASITLRFRIYGVQSITDCIGSVFGLSYWEMELLTITHFLAGGSTFDLCPTPLAEIQIPKQGRASKVFYKWL